MPLVVLGVASVAALPPTWQTITLRTVFVVVVCLLPAAMWYLFIANQKASPLNEYVMATADVVGLLVSTPYSPERVVDWVDQAILLTQLGPAKARGANDRTDPVLGLLRARGIRSASALAAAARSPGAVEVHRALDPDGHPEATEALLATMASNQNLQLVLTWRGQPPVTAETR